MKPRRKMLKKPANYSEVKESMIGIRLPKKIPRGVLAGPSEA